MTSAAEPVYHCEFAWLGGEAAERDVQLTVTDGLLTGVVPGAGRVADAVVLPGLTLPGLANTHSHVFHRAIRGRTQAGAADFWQWRNVMYQAASRLTPDNLYALARATYGEMLLAGITSVGECFYVRHQEDGTPYADPNEMGLAVARAAVDAGIRLTLLDTCYLQAGVDGTPPQGAQIRYSDGSWQAWAERVDALRAHLAGEPLVRVGAAIHRVRAVPRPAMAPIAEFCRERGMPLYAHVSEQPAENEACLAVFGLTPVELLGAEGVLSPSFTAVHATHLTDRDIELLGDSGSSISMCPTTERDLADGVGPAIRLAAAGCPLTVGSDGHMMIDLLEEGRAIELDERLVTGVRGHLAAPSIARAITTAGARSIGWPSAGLAVGAPADMTTIRLDSVRTAGARSGDVLAHALFAASAADVDSVILGGRRLVAGGTYLPDPDLGATLDAAIAAL
jgi:formiminoglutamate deiminase